MTAHPAAVASRSPKPPISKTPGTLTRSTDLLEKLGRKLSVRRAQRGMTRAELAERINCSPDAVLRAEIGEQPRSRTFWATADAVLRADGSLLDAADRANRHQASGRSPQQQPQRTYDSVKLPRYRQVQRTNRVFADRLSTTAARRQRCPHMAERVAHQRTRIEQELAALNETLRILLRRPDFTLDEVLTDLWQTLLTHDPFHASFLSAAALTELARSRPDTYRPSV